MWQSERVPFKLKAFNPISCARLLTSGLEMRLLAILLAVTLQPIFMGDVLQVRVHMPTQHTCISVGGTWLCAH